MAAAANHIACLPEGSCEERNFVVFMSIHQIQGQNNLSGSLRTLETGVSHITLRTAESTLIRLHHQYHRNQPADCEQTDNAAVLKALDATIKP